MSEEDRIAGLAERQYGRNSSEASLARGIANSAREQRNRDRAAAEFQRTQDAINNFKPIKLPNSDVRWERATKLIRSEKIKMPRHSSPQRDDGLDGISLKSVVVLVCILALAVIFAPTIFHHIMR